jgi:hypothetical protein
MAKRPEFLRIFFAAELPSSPKSRQAAANEAADPDFPRCLLCGRLLGDIERPWSWGGEDVHPACGEAAFQEAKLRGEYDEADFSRARVRPSPPMNLTVIRLKEVTE